MTRDLLETDIIIIGGGIAGASLAAWLSAHKRVALVEMEPQAGYHASGRSAASFFESYGNVTVRALTRASHSFFVSPPPGFAENPLHRPRPTLVVGSADQDLAIERYLADSGARSSVTEIAPEEALQLVPILRPSSVARATLEPSCFDIDVDQLLQAYLRTARRNLCQILFGVQVQVIEQNDNGWDIECSTMRIRARTLVNAAGAWADQIAGMASVAPIGIQPLRRSACTVAGPDGVDFAGWPLVVDVDERFYFKPDAGTLLLSSADAVPSPPMDAAPDELETATAIDRFESVTSCAVRRVIARWAGLRSFVADQTPVIGFAPNVEGFFWLAGQGGYGVQTAPAVAELASAMLLRHPAPSWATPIVDTLSPGRFHACVGRRDAGVIAAYSTAGKMGSPSIFLARDRPELLLRASDETPRA